MKNNNQPAQTTTKKRAGIRFYLLLGLVVLVLQIGTDLFQNFSKQAQTPNTTLNEVAKSQNSVKLIEIIERKEAEILKQLEEKAVENKDNPELYYATQRRDITRSNIEVGENFAKFVTNNLNLDEWTIENKTYIAVQIITMKNNYKKIQEIKPTEDYKEFHDMWIQASQLSGYADDDFVNGVDNKSTFLINSATTKNREATRQKSLAISMLKKISKNKGLEIE